MMHGYLAFDADGELLRRSAPGATPTPGRRPSELSALFGYNIPHALVDRAPVPGDPGRRGRTSAAIAHLTTLAGYVHWQLTGSKVLGIGDASGMFPIDTATAATTPPMLARFDELAAEAGVELRLADLLPEVLPWPGEPAGTLTEAGARRCSTRRARCAPASRSARPRATPARAWSPPTRSPRGPATSAPARASSRWSCSSSALDRCTTSSTWSPPPPATRSRWCTATTAPASSDAWAGLFARVRRARSGADVDTGRRSSRPCSRAALDGARDGGGLLAYNYLSGEPITGLDEGRPLFLRVPGQRADARPPSCARSCTRPSATLRIGMDVLQKDEGVRLDRMFAHGGLFRTEGVAQRLLAAAIGTPVAVGDTAGEGGAWGIAVLAAYCRRSRAGAEPGGLPGHRGLRRREPGDRRARPGRRRRLRRLHAAVRRRRSRSSGPPWTHVEPRPERGGHPMTRHPDRARHAPGPARAVAALHAELTRYELVDLDRRATSPSGCPGEDLFVIKPAAASSYDELTPEAHVGLRPRRQRSSTGDRAPSSRHRRARLRLPAHARGQRRGAHAQPYATAWAARAEAIPCVLTAMADEFGGADPGRPVRADRRRLDRPAASSTTLRGSRSPAVLMQNHGVFTIGPTRRPPSRPPS